MQENKIKHNTKSEQPVRGQSTAIHLELDVLTNWTWSFKSSPDRKWSIDRKCAVLYKANVLYVWKYKKILRITYLNAFSFRRL